MRHFYKPLLRPASACTLPPGLGWIYIEAPPSLAQRRPDLPVSKHRFGVIATVRALTPEELDHFSLEPMP